MEILGNSVETAGKTTSRSHQRADRERVVFTLNPESRAQFLPHFDPTALARGEYEWIDPSSLKKGEWEKFLFEWRPTVLVTGWGTPALPAPFVQSRDIPLRYICHLTGSVRQIVPRSLIERGMLVSNWGTSTSGSVAEHAMLLVLGALRNLPTWNGFMEEWPRQTEPTLHLPLETRTLRGKRVGLHGFGSIARELVQMLRPFGVDLAAYSWGVPPGLFEQHGIHRRGSLLELFANSDVLIECEALTSHSRGVVDEQILRCLPAEAVFVNVGRGQVVDEDALIRVAREKKLRLGLDVYREEPLPAASALRALSSALLSPHIAGPTKDGFADLCKFAVANLRRYLLGEPIEAEVTLAVYDRST